MATNLRLSPEAEAAVRAEAARSGRSQQAVIREAIERQLGLCGSIPTPRELDGLIAGGKVRAPRTPYRKATRRVRLPSGVESAALLDRDDRL